ncbi:Actin-related protein 8 [Mycena venus]|uniref:Actin-related protein 8 n=1 Tax=Mycena venus TaxID=2733690 RepID=A0A8H6YUJ4_9AGAR|nr:Actin-related protein 8 [Mycena venus]
MSKRSYSTKHTLPPNSEFIEFPRSDGDSTLWPTATKKEVDADGCVNFMKPVGLNESVSNKWRVDVADAISSELKLPGGKNYVLKDFPAGYRLFNHHKGKADSPRHDIYLYGFKGKSCRFRSVREFTPHAVWLFGDGSTPCRCKFCIKQSQRDTAYCSAASPSPSRPVRPKLERVERKNILSKPHLTDHLQSNKPDATTQRSINLPKVSPHIQVKHVMLPERRNDLLAAAACRPSSEGSLPRWFREGELVWCALKTPIKGDVPIRFWPAIVDSTPRQSSEYKVQFLAVQRSYQLPDTMVIPYQSYSTPDSIWKKIWARPAEDWDLSPDTVTAFDPCPPRSSRSPSFSDALAPLALALQIAQTISGFWCLTDDWVVKLPLPPAALPAQLPTPPRSSIELTGSNNATIGSTSSGPRTQGPPLVVRQTRFQSLWWGGERIWAGEMVRLKIPRKCLAPTGTQHIFPPLGPGNKSRSLAESREPNSAQFGAVSRDVFMKIDTIFMADSDGVGKRECRIAGMLYELSDGDWTDPNLPRNVNVNGASSSTSGQPAELPNPGTSAESLPPAPTGLKFRPILAPGHEVVMLLGFIGGRYYQGILEHPLMKLPLDKTGTQPAQSPSFYKSDRDKMVSDAHRDAMAILEEHVRDRPSQMDLD